MSRALLLCLLLLPMTAQAAPAPLQTPADTVIGKVALEQRIGAELPLQLVFRNAAGEDVRLGDFFGQGPVLLVPVWYSCPNLCGVTLRGLESGLREVDFSVGKDFRVVAVSVDPEDATAKAAGIRDGLVRNYGRPGAADGWQLLTGEAEAVRGFYRALGIGYSYDRQTRQYAHPATIVLATADGRISRYMPGVVFEPQHLRRGLLEAGHGRLGSVVDRVLLRCYSYDPATGRYSLLVTHLLRLAGSLTVVLLGGGMLLALWRERRRRRASP
jgi:protein SCO1/2